jgi:hypothetical protein
LPHILAHFFFGFILFSPGFSTAFLFVHHQRDDKSL